MVYFDLRKRIYQYSHQISRSLASVAVIAEIALIVYDSNSSVNQNTNNIYIFIYIYIYMLKYYSDHCCCNKCS